MFTTNAKIIKNGGAEPDQFEASISNALLELEMNSDLKSHLRELYITKAKELETNNKKVNLDPSHYFLFNIVAENCPKLFAFFAVDHHICTDAKTEGFPEDSNQVSARIGEEVLWQARDVRWRT